MRTLKQVLFLEDHIEGGRVIDEAVREIERLRCELANAKVRLVMMEQDSSGAE
jgi:hypothetical protein